MPAGRLQRGVDVAVGQEAQRLGGLHVILSERHDAGDGLELMRARKGLGQRSILSPIAGIVMERLLFNGEYLAQDGKLAIIAQLDPLHVEAFLPVKFYSEVRLGMQVQSTRRATMQRNEQSLSPPDRALR